MARRFRTSFTAATVCLLAATLAGSWGEWHWLFDLAAHFRAYWLVAAAVAGAIAIRRPRSTAFVCSAVALVGNTWAVLPFWMPEAPLPVASAAPAVESGPQVTLVVANVHRWNAAKPRAVAYLRARRPDIVVLLEIDAAWSAALADLADLYPHRIEEPRDDAFGVGIYSRWPLSADRVLALGGTPFPNIDVVATCHDRDVRLLATHPHAPITAAHAARLTDQLAALAEITAAERRPCIVVGDFNATPWSRGYRTFAAGSGLRDTALGRGIQPTWNARWIAPRIPIDHVFASPDLAVLRRAIGPDIGSDHLPVEATLLLPPAE